MYCSSPWKNPTYLCGCANHRFMGGSIGPRMEISETSGQPTPMVPRLHQSYASIKRKLRVWTAQKCIALVGEETVLTSAGPQITLFHGGQYRVGNGNMRIFGPTYRRGTALSQEECLHQKEATGMENPKMYCCSSWNNPTSCVGL